ncbi:MAG: hypothetical protein ABIK18_04400 [candidate division WOR-3 bacterium]
MICLQTPDRYFEEILRQAGLPYSSSPSPDTKIFITSSPFQVRLGTTPKPASDMKSSWVKVKFIAPDETELFRNVGLVDINARCLVPKNANHGKRNGKGGAFVYEKGDEIILPFAISQIFRPRGMALKRFYCQSSRLPWEKVAVDDRGGVRRILTNSIRHLLIKNNLPYVRLSYVPGSYRSVFGFRVDTDYSSLSDIVKTVKLAEKIGMRWSWFVATGSWNSRLKELIKILSEQDIQLHCHKHLVYNDFDRNMRNFLTGKELLQKVDVNPIGVASPYGEWNENLQKVFEELDFKYSSEFCYSYDDLPARPIISAKLSSVLQIPVHPISLGRLIWANANPKAILDYYRQVIDLQVARQEPCFLYDHPNWISRYPEIFMEILSYGIQRCGFFTTITDYYRWWRKREEVRYNVWVVDDGIEITVQNGGEDVYLIIEYQDRMAFIPLTSGKVKFDKISWQPLSISMPFNSKEITTRGREWLMRPYYLLSEVMRWRQIRKEMR